MTTAISVYTVEFPNQNVPGNSWDGGTTTVDNGAGFSMPLGGNDVVTLAAYSHGFDQGASTQGLLFLPQVPTSDPCSAQINKWVPKNITTLESIPSNYNALQTAGLVAVVPWVSDACMASVFNTVNNLPANEVMAMITYLPQDIALGNFPSAEPPAATSVAWNVGGNLNWQSQSKFPVFGINADEGNVLVTEMGLYSGNLTQAPQSANLSKMFDSTAFVRLYCMIDVPVGNNLPSLWVFLLIVLGILLFLICTTSVCMHTMQRLRRRAIERSIIAGEMDVEALGIKRLTVPEDILEKMPLIVYVAPEDSVEKPPHQAVPSTDAATARTAPIASTTPAEPTENKVPGEADRESDRISATRPSAASSMDEMAKPEPAGVAAAVAADLTEQAHLPSPSSLPHEHLAFSQPTCSICLEDFVSHGTIVRPLPCKHVFHPSCIDPVLREYSSLCPICKASVLPPGYCPEITNAMIRRIRGLQRMRELQIPRSGSRVDRTLARISFRQRAAQDVQLIHVMRPEERARAAAAAAHRNGPPTHPVTFVNQTGPDASQDGADVAPATEPPAASAPATTTVPELVLPPTSPTADAEAAGTATGTTETDTTAAPTTLSRTPTSHSATTEQTTQTAQTTQPPPATLLPSRPTYSRTPSGQSIPGVAHPAGATLGLPNLAGAPITETVSTDGAQARPANVSREEWARRRAEGMLEVPIPAVEADRREERRRGAWRRVVGTVFPIVG